MSDHALSPITLTDLLTALVVVKFQLQDPLEAALRCHRVAERQMAFPLS